MPIEHLGMVVTGQTDELALRELARKHLPATARIRVLTTNGPLKNKVVKFLRILDNDGYRYDAVLIINDADNKDPDAVRDQMRHEVGSHTFRFARLDYIVINLNPA